MGKVEKRKEKISKLSNETPLKRKFVYVMVNYINIKLQLDIGSDMIIINQKTWKKLGKPSLLALRKVAHGVSGKKINFLDEFACNIFSWEKLKKKLCLCLKKIIRNGYNCLIRSLEPAN